uniref:Protein kinase domain-containing protein n=1 Tax=Elphidium margaritaceum TaxID=933848 RepID=A0A7S0TCL4_9EUKA|mmetsp:Transcript_263/g.406  ORF Transcript_263/g.406 Transcript_263/m.406 type:complete len:418 (+) Transcript_263:101-1354(+)
MSNVKDVDDPQPVDAVVEPQTVRVLEHMGFQSPVKICKSLQGSIYRAQKPPNLRIAIHSISHTDNDDDRPAVDHNKNNQQQVPSLPVTPTTPSTPCMPVVIKVAHCKLHSKHLAKVGNRVVRVQENILLESDILRFLTHCNDCPPSIIKFYDFITIHPTYMLLMEDGGASLFGFVQSAHKLIKAGVLSANHWKQMVQKVFLQMLESIEFIHAHRVSHFDVSLENFLINDVNVEVTTHAVSGKERVEFMLNDVQIKLCDFGLAEYFSTDNFSTRKNCGKQNYKSPECLKGRDLFDAKKNDIFCLGVSLFMMMVGAPPWSMADESDALYTYMTNGLMKDVLVQWNKSARMDDHFIDLEERIFAPEARRISLSEIRNHAFARQSSHSQPRNGVGKHDIDAVNATQESTHSMQKQTTFGAH